MDSDLNSWSRDKNSIRLWHTYWISCTVMEIIPMCSFWWSRISKHASCWSGWRLIIVAWWKEQFFVLLRRVQTCSLAVMVVKWEHSLLKWTCKKIIIISLLMPSGYVFVDWCIFSGISRRSLRLEKQRSGRIRRHADDDIILRGRYKKGRKVRVLRRLW